MGAIKDKCYSITPPVLDAVWLGTLLTLFVIPTVYALLVPDRSAQAKDLAAGPVS